MAERGQRIFSWPRDLGSFMHEIFRYGQPLRPDCARYPGKSQAGRYPDSHSHTYTIATQNRKGGKSLERISPPRLAPWSGDCSLHSRHGYVCGVEMHRQRRHKHLASRQQQLGPIICISYSPFKLSVRALCTKKGPIDFHVRNNQFFPVAPEQNLLFRVPVMPHSKSRTL